MNNGNFESQKPQQSKTRKNTTEKTILENIKHILVVYELLFDQVDRKHSALLSLVH
jgi:hypothetical protein